MEKKKNGLRMLATAMLFRYFAGILYMIGFVALIASQNYLVFIITSTAALGCFMMMSVTEIKFMTHILRKKK